MPPFVFDDARIRAELDPETAVAAVRAAALAKQAGTLHAPARVHAAIGDGDLLFTVGRLEGECFGFRAYDTLVGAEQLVAVWGEEGEIQALVPSPLGSATGCAPPQADSGV